MKSVYIMRIVIQLFQYFFMNDSIVSEHIGAMQTFVLQEMYLVVVQNEDNVSIMQSQATLYDHRHPHIDKVCD